MTAGLRRHTRVAGTVGIVILNLLPGGGFAADPRRPPAEVRPGIQVALTYSVAWPRGEGWMVRGQGAANAAFLQPPDPTGISRAATIVAQRAAMPIGGARELAMLVERGNRVRIAEIPTDRDGPFGGPCVRYEHTDDSIPGSQLKLIGRACVHPAARDTVLDASYSVRAPTSKMPGELRAEAEAFFAGIAAHQPPARPDDWRKLAEAGDAGAQVWWANHLAPGDPARLRWLEKAAGAGQVEAMTLLGLARLQGLGAGTDRAAALRWLRRAADAGYARGAAMLGFALSGGDAEERAEAPRHLSRAAEAGDGFGQFQYGLWLLSDRAGGNGDRELGARFVAKAAAQGIPAAQSRYGELLLAGVGVAADPDAARFWHRMAAAQGDPMARRRLAGTLY